MIIKNSHFLITGSNRGIGQAMAEQAARMGANVYLANRKTETSFTEKLKELGAASVHVFEVDLSQRSSIEKLIQDLKSYPIDVLFNNAGQMSVGQLEKQDVDAIYSMMQVNVTGLFHLTHGILPGMLERKKGKIINHASVMAVMQLPASSTYGASKAAVVAFNQSLNAELEGTGVTTLLLLTPGVETDMFKDIPNQVGKNFKPGVFSQSISSKEYAKMIADAVERDLEVLKPSGSTGLFLKLAQHTPRIYRKLMKTQFARIGN